MDRCCRICWNTADWRYPTGEAKALEQGKSYVRENGFGHEEWLFNFAWMQPAPGGGTARYRYGFLQPIGKFRDTYKGSFFNILLYTVAPDKRRMSVGIIHDLFVPEDDELEEAHATIRKNGWLDAMGEDLTRLSIPASALVGKPAHVINVRFEQSKVSFFDPRVILPPEHVSYRINRYHPLEWNGVRPSTTAPQAAIRAAPQGGQMRSEAERTRAAVQGVTYDPRHVILQNAVYKHLCAQHGKRAVYYEHEFVDLRLETSGVTTFFELKTSTSEELPSPGHRPIAGVQHLSTKRLASKLVVVGDREANADDRAYLEYLRREFGLPIYYQQWEWPAARLGPEC
jgi:hypothetical protein